MRQAVLQTWTRSPARFREDANAEESLAHIGYADRVVVELAANASDAAIAAGVPGRLRFWVVDGELRAANTGAPLTKDGVEALASLRASAKRDLVGGTGHFGVGFTAVLSVTDNPQIYCAAGGIEFSLDATVTAVKEQNSTKLLSELESRLNRPPILRLPWAVPAVELPAGFVTEVRLPLRSGVDATTILAAAGDYLLLTLPGLDVIELPGRTLTRHALTPRSSGQDLVTIIDNEVSTTWQLSRRSGVLDASFTELRPVEERGRNEWWVTWAAPLEQRLGGQDDVMYAPTPTDEALHLPARLIGSFPVDDTRRHLATGSLADFMVAEAVKGYLDLLTGSEPARRLELIPTGGFGLSRLDTQLRLAILERARTTELLVTVLGDAVAGQDAVVLPSAPDELARMVAEAIPNLLPVPDSSAAVETLRTLGVQTLETFQMSSALAGLGRPPQFWGRLYELLGYASAEDLADLPIPLADGRTVLGGRGLLIPEVSGPDSQDFNDGLHELVAVLPELRLVAPEAVTSEASRQLLLRLGGSVADPSAILADPTVAARIQSLLADLDHDESPSHFESFAAAVLSLVAQGGRAPDGMLADLILTSDDDEPWPAGQLLLPGSEFAELVDPEADLPFVADFLVTTFGSPTLAKAGVLADFRVIHDDDALGPDHDLPDEDLWWAEVMGGSASPMSFTAIADLDLVDDLKWPQALAAIFRNREALGCLQPSPNIPISYSRWWLANFANLHGQPPKDWKLATATDLGDLFETMPAGFDAEHAELIGVRTGLAQVLADDPEALLDRLADSRRKLAAGLVPRVTSAVVAALSARTEVGQPPDTVRTLDGGVALAEDALVLDQPWLAQVLPAAELVPGGHDPESTARVLDVELASVALNSDDLAPQGKADAHSDRAAVLATWQKFGGDPSDVGWLTSVQVISKMTIEVERVDHRISWWVAGASAWVDGTPAGWGRLLAHRRQAWGERHLAIALLSDAAVETTEFGLD